MSKEKGVLGRGLAAILGNNTTDIIDSSKNKKTNESSVNLANTHEILISQIVTNPFQPRMEFNHERLNELAISIEKLGIIQPITVRKMQEKEFQLISGERRLRAAKIAGLNKIPSFIRIANDQEMLEMALVENIQRENLNPIEVALSYERLIQEIKLTQEECSERVGKKRSTVANFLRLLKLPEEIQKGLIHGLISNGHARALLSIESSTSKINLYHDIMANGYSVREVEQLAKEFSRKIYKQISKAEKIKDHIPFSQQKIIYDLSQQFHSDIELKQNKKGNGKLIIPFEDEEGLQEIIRILKK